jgi:hypothetical protein
MEWYSRRKGESNVFNGKKAEGMGEAVEGMVEV